MKLGAHIDTNRHHQVHHERVDLRGDAIDGLEIHRFEHDAIGELMPLSRDVQMHARVLVAFQPVLLRLVLFERVVFRALAMENVHWVVVSLRADLRVLNQKCCCRSRLYSPWCSQIKSVAGGRMQKQRRKKLKILDLQEPVKQVMVTRPN